MSFLKQFHPVVREWLLLLALLVVLAFLLPIGMGRNAEGFLWRSDRSMFDSLMEINQRTPQPQLVIVGIDDASLDALGPWAWPRNRHAQLLEKIKPAKAVFLDIEFSEPDKANPQNDELLANAIRDHKKVVVPLAMQTDAKGLVSPRFAIDSVRASAAAMGHIQVVADSDGIMRRTSLEMRLGENTFVHSVAAMLEVAGLGPKVYAPLTSNPLPSKLVATQQRLIAYSGGVGNIPQVSYSKVLDGTIPPSFFADKLVFVGLTTLNSGELYPTPHTGAQNRNMPGIEIHANIADTLLSDTKLRELSAFEIGLLTSLILIGVFACFLTMSPRWALVSTFVAMVLVFIICVLMLKYANVWSSPIYALILLAFAFPLWSWRRLEGAQRYAEQEINRLAQQKLKLPSIIQPLTQTSTTNTLRGSQFKIVDHIESRFGALREIGERVADANQFVSDSLDQGPDGVVVTDVHGEILLANPRAALYLSKNNEKQLVGQRLSTVLSEVELVEGRTWTAALEPVFTQSKTTEIEGRTASERDLLVRLSPLYNSRARQTGVIASLIEISQLRQAERKRDDSIKVLTHDIRTPQAAMLSLIELHEQKPQELPASELIHRLKKYSERTIAMAEGFLRLATAEQGDRARFTAVDLMVVLDEACDEAWPLANQRSVKIERAYTKANFDEAVIQGDHELLRRMIVNLLSNAIKYSPAGVSVVVSIEQSVIGYRIDVLDKGYGIPKDMMERLFGRFNRIPASNPEKIEGVGLGLAMVRAVARLHAGEVSVVSVAEADATSEQPHGSRFSVQLSLGKK